MPMNQGDSIRCAHYVSKYLTLTQNWIYRTIINHDRVVPTILSRKKDNLNLFPVKNLYSLQDLSTLRQYAEIAFFRMAGYFYFFDQTCKRNSIQILHIHFGYQGVKSVGLKKKLKVPMVCSFYGDDAFAYRFENTYTELFNHADKILVLGKYMKARLVTLGCPEHKLQIHHLGIDIEKLRFVNRRVTKNSPIRFLIASSFLPKKGIELAIKALATFAREYDFTLDIIGDGPLKNDILREIEQGGLKERVTLHGYKPYDYFINLAYECQVFIQASRTTENNDKEGTPMAIVDTMATGMTVVSTYHSDIPEIVIDGETGYLARENDLDSLTACMRKVFEHPEKIEAFSAAGRRWIEQEFDAKKQTLRLEGYYAELLKRDVL